MAKVYIGIDNGVTGTLAVVGELGSTFRKVPTKIEVDYQKSKVHKRTRIDHMALCEFLSEVKTRCDMLGLDIMVVCERPMSNKIRFDATVSAARAMESTVIALETYQLPYQWIDSGAWQKVILPKGCKGDDLKKASADIGCRLFPAFTDAIRKHKDADSLLMVEWARRAGR
jgi:hypothetical protein